jgi:hypothetical protein
MCVCMKEPESFAALSRIEVEQLPAALVMNKRP